MGRAMARKQLDFPEDETAVQHSIIPCGCHADRNQDLHRQLGATIVYCGPMIQTEALSLGKIALRS